MSRFFSQKFAHLVPYTPGEQPKDQQYIKLNTNESPFPPHPAVLEAAKAEAGRLQLYPDPECKELVQALAKRYGVEPDEILLTNGSDDILNFAFMAFCDEAHPAAFPNITYGFYKVFAEFNGVPYTQIPLKEDFTIDIRDYFRAGKTLFIANPNAPTGIALSLAEIEEILQNNPDNVVVIDEAYVDFGAESAIPLIRKYENLLVTQTFSKSRSMAVARLGYGIGCKALIQDLNTIKYSTNPYNINRMTMATGLATLQKDSYAMENCKTVMENRAFATEELQKMGFCLTDSSANFLFARHPGVKGKELYLTLKARGILVRHFDQPLIGDYIRITVGTKDQMQSLLKAISQILEEQL